MKRLITIQQELKAPKDKRNQFGKFNYRSASDILESLKPLLAKEKLAIIMRDDVEEHNGVQYLRATVSLFDEGGTAIAGASALAEISNHTGMSKDQCTGAASSYARKYALCGLFAIDDSSLDPDSMDNRTPAPSNSAPLTSVPTAQQKPLKTNVDPIMRASVNSDLDGCKTKSEAMAVLDKYGVDIKSADWSEERNKLNARFK